MQSISTFYTDSISLLDFRKPRGCTFDSAMTEESCLHRSPSNPFNYILDPMKVGNEYQKKHEIDCSSTLDTSTSSSMGDSMEEHYTELVPAESEKEERTHIERVPMTNFRKHKLRRKLAVRFSPGTCLEPKRARRMRKRKTMSDCDPARWYTRTELKNIQNSCISDLCMRQHMSTMQFGAKEMQISDDPILDRFSEGNRKRRKLARWKMYETTRILKEFETVTGNKTEPEFLSQLLRRHSKPMKMDAVELALKMRMAGEVSDPLPSLFIPAKTVDSVPSRSTNRLQLSSEEMHATLTYARMVLRRSHMVEQRQQTCTASLQYHRYR